MEVYKSEGWTVRWLSELMSALRDHDGWGISVGVDKGHMLLFSDRIMVTGEVFKDCHSLDSVVLAARLATERYLERKYGPLSRQLAYVKKQLTPAMKLADENKYSHLATFDGYETREGHAIWMLQTRNKQELMLDIDSSPSRATAVSADETMYPKYCKEFWPYKDVHPPYWLLVYLIKDRTKLELMWLKSMAKRLGRLG